MNDAANRGVRLRKLRLENSLDVSSGRTDWTVEEILGAKQWLLETGEDWEGSEVDFQGAGYTFIEPLVDEAGNKIGEARVHRANKTADDADFTSANLEKPVSFHNKVDITLYKGDDATPEDVAYALRQFGVDDPKPATPEALKVIKENKMIALLQNKHDGAVNFAGDTRAKVLAEIEKEWGLTADDVSIEVVPGSGHVQFLAPLEFGEKVAQATGTRYLVHNSSATNKTDVTQTAEVLRRLVGKDALLATAERRSVGKNQGGMSSSNDVLGQGGNYMFFSPVSKIGSHSESYTDGYSYLNPNSASYVLNSAEVFRRLDWYYNTSDKYGRRIVNFDPVAALTSSKGTGGELMVKHTVDLPSATHKLNALSETTAKNIVNWFHANRGGKLPDGRPIEVLFNQDMLERIGAVRSIEVEETKL
jgi:hypothetical protein